jgi:hypothetical protein
VKIIDSKGLVVRVGGTVHVASGGAVTPPFDPTPLNDAIAALTNRTDDNDARLNDLTDASPVEVWDVAAVYPAGTVMRHSGSTWLAKSATVAGDEPKPTSAAWVLVTLEGLYALIAALTARVAALETPSPPPPPPVAPDASWSKDDIVVWLEDRGLTFTKKVLDGLSLDELLAIAVGVTTTP